MFVLLEFDKVNSEYFIECKIKEKGYKLNELIVYFYDLIDVDEDVNKIELVKKFDDVISYKFGVIGLVYGLFFSKYNNLLFIGLLINKFIKFEIKS